MERFPSSKKRVLQLVLISIAPVASLVLTMISFRDLLDRLLQVVF